MRIRWKGKCMNILNHLLELYNRRCENEIIICLQFFPLITDQVQQVTNIKKNDLIKVNGVCYGNSFKLISREEPKMYLINSNRCKKQNKTPQRTTYYKFKKKLFGYSHCMSIFSLTSIGRSI